MAEACQCAGNWMLGTIVEYWGRGHFSANVQQCTASSSSVINDSDCDLF